MWGKNRTDENGDIDFQCWFYLCHQNVSFFPLVIDIFCLNVLLPVMNCFIVSANVKVLFDFFGHILCMDNLVRPFSERGKSQASGGGSLNSHQDRACVLGVNENGNGSKWVNDALSSTEILVHIKHPSGEKHPTGEEQCNQQPSQQLALINYHLSELMDFVRSYRERLVEKDRKELMAKEWKAAGLVFDRIFFLVYVIAIVSSLCVIMPIITLRNH